MFFRYLIVIEKDQGHLGHWLNKELVENRKKNMGENQSIAPVLNTY